MERCRRPVRRRSSAARCGLTALGEDPGDLSSVENPEALDAIATPSYRLDRRKPMRLALAQIDSVVRRTRLEPRSCGTTARGETRGRGRSRRLSRLAVTGYPPEDLLLRQGFLREAGASARRDRGAGDEASSPSSGHPMRRPAGCSTPAPSAGTSGVQAVYRKRLLPNYGVFDRGALLRYREARRRCSDLGGLAGAGRRADKTSGSPARRRQTAPRRARRCSSTCRRRRSTWPRTASASRCLPSARAKRGCAVVLLQCRRRTEPAQCVDGNSFVLDADGEVVTSRAGLRGCAARHGVVTAPFQYGPRSARPARRPRADAARA